MAALVPLTAALPQSRATDTARQAATLIDPLEDEDRVAERVRTLLDVNLRSTMALVDLVLPPMREAVLFLRIHDLDHARQIQAVAAALAARPA